LFTGPSTPLHSTLLTFFCVPSPSPPPPICSAFHISEDVFAGYNHTLRAGNVKFKEYISVGKGRDMGFDSINSFESKVGRREGREAGREGVWGSEGGMRWGGGKGVCVWVGGRVEAGR
jgi:hypothetical protein